MVGLLAVASPALALSALPGDVPFPDPISVPNAQAETVAAVDDVVHRALHQAANVCLAKEAAGLGCDASPGVPVLLQDVPRPPDAARAAAAGAEGSESVAWAAAREVGGRLSETAGADLRPLLPDPVERAEVDPPVTPSDLHSPLQGAKRVGLDEASPLVGAGEPGAVSVHAGEPWSASPLAQDPDRRPLRPGDGPAAFPPAPFPDAEASSWTGGAAAASSNVPRHDAAAAGVLLAGSMVVAVPLLALALYRRIVAARALEHPLRRALYHRIVAAPGLTPADLAAAEGLHYTSVVHHLRILEASRHIEVARRGGTLHCFENHARYGVAQKSALVAARQPTSRSILEGALREPGVPAAQVARALGIGRSAMKERLDTLAAWGLVATERDGRDRRVSVPTGARDAVVAALQASPSTATPTHTSP